MVLTLHDCTTRVFDQSQEAPSLSLNITGFGPAQALASALGHGGTPSVPTEAQTPADKAKAQADAKAGKLAAPMIIDISV